MFYLERLGAFVPDTSMSVEEIGALVGLTANQVHFYTHFLGLNRIVTAPGVGLAEMLSAAGESALDTIDRDDVRFLIHAHTAQHAAPPSWHLLEQVRSSLCLRNVTTLGVSHQNCVIGLYAFQIARYLLHGAAPEAKALIVIGEKILGHSSYLIPDTTIMGEAAAACIVGRSPDGDQIIGQATRILGRFYQGLGGCAKLQTEYKSVYLNTMAQVMRQALADSSVAPGDLAAVLPHNVNRMSWKRVARELGVPADRIYLDNVARLGHCFGADPIINLVTAEHDGQVGPGDLVLLASAGLGASFGATVLRLGDRRGVRPRLDLVPEHSSHPSPSLREPIPMNRTEVLDSVGLALSAVLNRDLPGLSEDSRLFEDLGMDSTSVIELLINLETSIDLVIEPDSLEPEVFRTVGTLADYIKAAFDRPVAA